MLLLVLSGCLEGTRKLKSGMRVRWDSNPTHTLDLTTFVISATTEPRVRRPVECGAAIIALEGALQLLINRYG